jgi:uncharacterized membrane protein YphA (DoxX/SURF4 family)
MSQNISREWSETEKIIFRLSFCYLIFYFVFLSSFFAMSFDFPIVGYIHKPFNYISESFVSLVNRIFIHNQYHADIYTGLSDTSWSVIASASYLILAVLITAIWTFLDKRKAYLELFTYLQTYARYYVAFVLLSYGLLKLFENQFSTHSANLILPVGNINPHTLLWTFMNTSEAYNFFAGMVETIAGAFLLFRRTTTLGAFIAIASLVNVLMLNIGYDTMVKMLILHLIIISLFILSPDVKRLLHMFVSKPSISLATFPRTAVLKKFKLHYVLKFTLIVYFVFAIVKYNIEVPNRYFVPSLDDIDGIYEIKAFSRNRENVPPVTTDKFRWKKFTIQKTGYASIQFMNDSSMRYKITADSISKSLTISSWNDSTFNSKLYYIISSPGEFVFKGTCNNDSIHFASRKVNPTDLPLLKDKGKIKWVRW